MIFVIVIDDMKLIYYVLEIIFVDKSFLVLYGLGVWKFGNKNKFE